MGRLPGFQPGSPDYKSGALAHELQPPQKTVRGSRPARFELATFPYEWAALPSELRARSEHGKTAVKGHFQVPLPLL
jgi:hypothetical protein